MSLYFLEFYVNEITELGFFGLSFFFFLPNIIILGSRHVATCVNRSFSFIAESIPLHTWIYRIIFVYLSNGHLGCFWGLVFATLRSKLCQPSLAVRLLVFMDLSIW